MYTNITAVALRTVRHNDRSSILTAWSPSVGRLSLIMPAGKGKESQRRRAITMPLSLFEGTVDIRRNTELLMVRDMKAWTSEGTRFDVSSHPVRSAVAMFIAEVLSVVTREGDADKVLWNLITETVSSISSGSSTVLSNIPVMFLLRLAGVLGIEPDYSEWHQNSGFDMLEGTFRRTRSLHDYWISSDQIRPVIILSKAAVGYRHAGIIHLPHSVRSNILNGVLGFFSLHHFPMNRLRSLDILKTIFAT